MSMRTTLHIAFYKNIEILDKFREANALKVPNGSTLRLIETRKYLMSSDYLLNPLLHFYGLPLLPYILSEAG